MQLQRRQTMKAQITIVDDNGKIIYKDYILEPIEDTIVGTSGDVPIREVRYGFTIRQLMDKETNNDRNNNG